MPSPSNLPPTFTYREALELGYSKRAIYALRDAGEIELVSRGLYRRQDATIEADEDLLEIAQRALKATLCLSTALAKHDLTDEIPSAPNVALPRGTRTPAIRARVRWHHFDPRTFDIGRERLVLDSRNSIGLYSAERSIVDAFRLRGLEGRDVANEALRRWLRRPGSQPSSLLALASRFQRAVTPLRQALEVLL
jgi:predicted transcriptional regulator of viral defense system